MTDPRTAVLDQLTEAYEQWAEREQLLLADPTKMVEAVGAHRCAVMILRAMDAEENNPPPKPVTT